MWVRRTHGALGPWCPRASQKEWDAEYKSVLASMEQQFSKVKAA